MATLAHHTQVCHSVKRPASIVFRAANRHDIPAPYIIDDRRNQPDVRPVIRKEAPQPIPPGWEPDPDTYGGFRKVPENEQSTIITFEMCSSRNTHEKQ